ncbi:MAG: GerMN domain-containing protein [Candidatus Nomurabacteria bacterium]|nr:GerMN domain-containing protein [Candidatus Nomurabacteria bacterium]
MIKKIFLVLVVLLVGGALISLFWRVGVDIGDKLNPDYSVVLFFPKTDSLESGASCSAVFPVTRTVLYGQNTPEGALDALFSGASEKDRDMGYVSALGSFENSFKSLDFFEDGSVHVTLEQPLAGTQCKQDAGLAQITQTLLQFPEITNVTISDQEPVINLHFPEL